MIPSEQSSESSHLLHLFVVIVKSDPVLYYRLFVRGNYSQLARLMGANMGPTWDLLAPDGPHVGPYKPCYQGWSLVHSPWKGPIIHGLFVVCLNNACWTNSWDHWFGMPWTLWYLIHHPYQYCHIWLVCVMIEHTDRISYEDCFSKHSAYSKKFIHWNNIMYSKIIIFAHLTTHSIFLVLQILMFK